MVSFELKQAQGLPEKAPKELLSSKSWAEIALKQIRGAETSSGEDG